MKKYEDLTAAILKSEYLVKRKSCGEIATEYNTYPKKVLRLLQKLGIKTRNRLESQKLSAELHHPTKGKHRTEAEKLKISEGRAAKWSPEAKQRASEKAKENWKTRSRDKETVLHSANVGLRESAKHGSKLEMLVWDTLQEMGYEFSSNEPILVDNQKMRVDIFVPKLHLVIEVDGPFHSLPIYGEEKLAKTQKADNEKNVLVLKDGLNLLRIGIAKKNISNVDARNIKRLAEESIGRYRDCQAKGFLKVVYE